NNSGSDLEASEVLTFSPQASNRISLTGSISDLPLNIGDTIKFNINGVDFEFNSGYSIKNIMDKINSSDAGVTIKYSDLTDRFTITSKQTGAAHQINYTDIEGGFLDAILSGTGQYTAGTDAVVTIGTDL